MAAKGKRGRAVTPAAPHNAPAMPKGGMQGTRSKSPKTGIQPMAPHNAPANR